TARGLENRLVPAGGFPLKLVKVGALNRVSLATRLKTALDLPRAIFSAAGILNEFQPDVVIGVGGYASGPAMLAAIVTHIPRVAFEPNVVPGFANRVVAHFVSAAAVHFKGPPTIFIILLSLACLCVQPSSRFQPSHTLPGRLRCSCSAAARERVPSIRQ
ncbi:MAG TPA: UDP-N-acetylglucosamine--N-acetylmuramyl-(pentapeptide) pyrophosphoryl-undecaprenol N-acetylglucosamine transferase, partial [Bryobacteraceae bacterium]